MHNHQKRASRSILASWPGMKERNEITAWGPSVCSGIAEFFIVLVAGSVSLVWYGVKRTRIRVTLLRTLYRITSRLSGGRAQRKD